MLISHKLLLIREAMSTSKIDAYIIPSSDPHQSEYVANHWKSRAWITGFTGSAGTAVVSHKASGLWTDSRYFIQAEMELKDSEILLHKVYNQGSPQFIDWIIDNLDHGDMVGCDGALFSKMQIDSYEKKLAKAGIKLEVNHDLFAQIWKDRPNLPSDPLLELDIQFVGESRSSKLKRIRSKMKQKGANLHLVSTLDDIAWIFNIRCNDVTYNPVAISYAIITDESAILFIHKDKVPEGIKQSLAEDEVTIMPYEEIWNTLNNIDPSSKILIDENSISIKLFRAINTKNIINSRLPSICFKAIKNVVEIQHFRNAMEKDGIALTRFFIWLENNINENISEYDIVQKLAYFRSLMPGYKSESFGAIVGYKENGAIVHYSPSKDHSAIIKPTGVLLIDSGGQYLDGTTDITRTISLGDATSEEKNAYTRVLKGHIALDQAIFPEGTLGVQLDTLARTHLWEDKLNYLHGTGHGIGFFLNVHEGPQGFHPGIAARSKNTIDEHMVTTNEPGYYETGKFGIRIENCLLTIKEGSSESGNFLKFETLTLFPIETNLIDINLMTAKEVNWLNRYHQEVFRRLSPHLDKTESKWLSGKCQEI